MINKAHTTNVIGFTYKGIREFKHLNNAYMDKCIRISKHLISHDSMDNSSKLALLSLHRYYMTKYLKSIRTRVGRNNKSRSSSYSLRFRASFSYVCRKAKSIVKYFSELSRMKIIKEFIRFPNVTIVHCERSQIPQYSTLKEAVICRIIELYRYKIPNYIRYKRGKY